MEEKKSHQAVEIITNEDKLKLALKDYTDVKSINKELFSSVIALLSLIFSVTSSQVTSFLGFSAEIILYVIWSVIVLLSLYVLKLVANFISIKIKKNNTYEWFKNILIGIDNKDQNISIGNIFVGLYESFIALILFLWKVIGYILLGIFYLFPVLLLVAIGFWIGWSNIFQSFQSLPENQVPGFVPYFFFGILGILLLYVYVYSEENGLGVVQPVREFFEVVFDISAPFYY